MAIFWTWKGRALAAELGDAAVFLHMDVSIESDWTRAIEVSKQFGTLNVLGNNAAIVLMKSIVDTTPEDYMRVY